MSTIRGVGFAAVADDTVHFGMLALYAVIGGVFCRPGRAARPPWLSNPPPLCGLNRSVDVGWVSTSAEGSAASTPF
jgi:hypothetical protein